MIATVSYPLWRPLRRRLACPQCGVVGPLYRTATPYGPTFVGCRRCSALARRGARPAACHPERIAVDAELRCGPCHRDALAALCVERKRLMARLRKRRQRERLKDRG
jgi:hypothetical protein